MTGPDSADTGQMHAAAEAIGSAYQALQGNTQQIVDLLAELANTVNEAGTTQALRRLGENLSESDTAIHQRLLAVGQYLGDSASVIETVLQESQTDMDQVTRQVASGGRYGQALNG